jgi:hypothetical protein
MKRITLHNLMKWNPCKGEEEILEITGGRRQMSPPEVLDCHVSAVEKMWVLLRNPIFTDRELRLIACDFADEVLPIYENANPNDNRTKACIEMARKFANGEFPDEERNAARNAARAAARQGGRTVWAAWAAWAAMDAASEDAEDAAWAAAGAARNAAADAGAAAGFNWDSAWAAAVEQQLEIVRKYLEAQI